MLTKLFLKAKKLRAELIAEAFVPADMKGFLEGGNESLSLINEVVDYAINHRDEFKHPLVHAFNDVKIGSTRTKSRENHLCGS